MSFFAGFLPVPSGPERPHPTHGYLPGATADSWENQCAALAYADTHLGRLFHALPDAGPWLVVLCADHGDTFGEDGHHGDSRLSDGRDE
jgi:arylsulfatase A-like enzyme